MNDSKPNILEQNSQEQNLENNGGEKNSILGGYMAIYHDIEEICYGPESGMPPISRVFFCIRHKLLRDGLGQKAIGHSFIIKKTGLLKRQVITLCKKLEASGLILIQQNKIETEWGTTQYSENSYQLNPEKFGDIFNWYKNNPTVRVYGDGKTRSYSKKGVVPNGALGVVLNQAPGVVPNGAPGEGFKISELLDNLLPNNPSSNNPKKITLGSGGENSFSLGKTEEEIAKENREKYERQREQLLKEEGIKNAV